MTITEQEAVAIAVQLVAIGSAIDEVRADHARSNPRLDTDLWKVKQMVQHLADGYAEAVKEDRHANVQKDG